MTPCIEWGGSYRPDGYGRGGWTLAHRVVWAKVRGPIPEGLFVLHHCDNRRCVNVDHLYLGTHADNMRDMVARGRGANASTKRPPTHCLRGHPFDEANTYSWAGTRANGTPTRQRHCRRCANDRSQTYRQRRVAALQEKRDPGE